jgi:amino acid adenylation domain-containing protein
MQTEIIEGYRLSPQQKHLWLLQQNARTPAFSAQCAILVEGALNAESLRAALEDVVQRHEILRTTYQGFAGMEIPVQVIADGGISWESGHDLTGLARQQQENTIEAILTEARRQSFDLERGPLLRASLLTLSPERHLLLATLPALSADRATLKNLALELSRSYAARLGESRTDEPLQYADIAEWQNDIIKSESAATGREFWRRQDIQVLRTLKLPFEVQASDISEFEPQLVKLALSPDVVMRIEELARQYDASTPIFLLICWQILLSRLTGKPEVLVGTSFDGRNYQELDEALGLFARYLPIHCRLEDGARFNDILTGVNALCAEAHKWQECFTWESMAGAADGQATPFFLPVGFEFEKQTTKYPTASVTFSLYKQYVCHERFKIKLACVETDDSLIAELHYDANLIPQEYAKRLLGQFRALLESALNNPQSEVNCLNLLNDSERQQFVVELNETKAAYPKNKCVHQLFEDQVRRNPQRVAVMFEKQRLTFAELNARANNLAHYLQSLGVGPEMPVAICVERSVEMIVGLLGILKAGGAYLPLDPMLPQERLAFMLEDAEAKILLTQQHLLEHLPRQNQLTIVRLDTDAEVINLESDENPASSVGSENLVYVLFTSGSTGRPKGVCVEHRQLLNYVHAVRERFGFAAGDSFAVLSTFAADLGNTMIFPSLCGGGCLHVISHERASDADALADYVHHHLIDYLKIVPSHLEALLAAARPERILPTKRLILGGEAPGQRLIERLSALLVPDCALANHYGPTEATVGVLTYPADAGREKSSAALPLGRPIANAQVYLLDAQLKPVPAWTVGELYIGGAGLARGYLKESGMIAEKFIPNPFSHEPGERLYRTGDLARYLPGGDIEFLGRADQQVKIRGFRIELGEIEMALARLPEVREAVVLAREETPGKKHLVAYLVAEQDCTLSVGQIRDSLKKFLPEHMLPAAFVILKALPLTPNGKVDRQALLAPEPSRATKMEYVAPRDELESVLAGVWEKVLGLAPVGIFDNYFALGGDSIRVIQLVHEANRYHLALTAMDVFQHPTIYKLAQHIRDGRDNERINRPAPLELIKLPEYIFNSLPDEMEDAYPLAKMQEFVIFHYAHDHQGAGVYHIQHSYHISDETLSLGAFKRALQLLAQKHAALRTVFLFDRADEPLQAVKKKIALPLKEEDIRHLSAAEQDEHIDAAMKEDRAKPFDVSDAGEPLFRITLFIRFEHSLEFFMSMHHAITDGWGNREFANELVELYLALQGGDERELPPSINTYKEFVALEREITADSAARGFWKDHLNGWRHRPLKPKAQSLDPSAETNYTYMLTSELAGQLNQLARASSVSLKAVFLSAYLELIGAETGESRVTVGVVSNGRSERLSDPLKALGLFWNIIPFHCPLNTDGQSSQIRKVQELLIGAEQYASYPLAQMLKDQQKTELFFATFNFLHFHNIKDLPAEGGLRLLGFRGHDKFHFPLNYIVSVNPFDGNIGFRVEFDQLYFSGESVRLLTDKYVDLLRRYAETQLGD